MLPCKVNNIMLGAYINLRTYMSWMNEIPLEICTKALTNVFMICVDWTRGGVYRVRQSIMG